MKTSRKTLLLVARLCLLAAVVGRQPYVSAAQRMRPSARSFSARPSASVRSARTSRISPSHYRVRAPTVRSGGARVAGGRSMIRSPSARTVGRARARPSALRHPSTRVGGKARSRSPVRTPDRVRVGPVASRRPAVRDPSRGVRRSPRLKHSLRPSYGRRPRRYPYYRWRPDHGVPYGVHYPRYWYHRPWYYHHRPWPWHSWYYYSSWWYPYYDGWYFWPYDSWWDGWGFGAAFYYSPSYDYPAGTAIEVTERVVNAGTTAEPTSPDIAEAKRLFEKGMYGDAAEMYRRLSRADGNDAFVRLAHANCLLADGRYEYAAYVVRRTIQLEPDWEEIFMHLRGYYVDWGTFVNQVVELERYIAGDPDNTAARFLLGYTYLFWDRYEDAAGVFRALAAHHPEDKAARYFLSMTGSSEKHLEVSS